MIRFLTGLYDRLEKRRSLLWLIILATAGLMAFFAFRLDYSEDISDFFPDAGGEAFADLKMKDKTVFIISGSDDPYELCDAADLLADKLQASLDIRHLLNVGGRDRPRQAAFPRKQPCPGEGIELDDVLHQKIHTRSVLFCGASPFFLIITESLWKNQKIRCTKDTNVKFSFCLKQTMKPKIGRTL